MTKRVGRWLLRAYPRSFREQFGEEFLADLEDLWNETPDPRARADLVARLALDGAVSAPRERLEALTQGFHLAAHEGIEVAPRWLRAMDRSLEVGTQFTTSILWIVFVASVFQPGFEWALFGLGGVGRSGAFPVLLGAVGVALLLATSWRRGGRFWWSCIATWHLLWAGLTLHSVVRAGWEARVRGDTYGFDVPALVLAPLFVAIAFVACLWVRFTPRRVHHPESGTRPYLWAALLLTVPLAVAFQSAEPGPKIGIALTVVQWLTLWRALRSQNETTALST